MMHTKIVKINDAQALKTAVTALRNGKIVIYPTETSYGLGADFTNEAAMKKTYALKRRDKDKKVSIACSSIKMAKKYIEMDEKSCMIAKKFMQGPLTLVCKGSSFRIPDNEFALKMIKKLGKPVTATSANISGQKSIYKIKEIVKIFDGAVDVIIDAGDLPVRRNSTVLDADSMMILRKGPVTMKKIRSALEK